MFQILKLAVVVFPLAARWDRLDSVPMFYNLAVSNTEEVVKRGVNAIEGTFTDRKCETPFYKQAMKFVICFCLGIVG